MFDIYIAVLGSTTWTGNRYSDNRYSVTGMWASQSRRHPQLDFC